jgi:hypothetical protein
MAGEEEEVVGWDGVEARHEKITGLLHRDKIAGGMALSRQREQRLGPLGGRRGVWASAHGL